MYDFNNLGGLVFYSKQIEKNVVTGFDGTSPSSETWIKLISQHTPLHNCICFAGYDGCVGKIKLQ